MKINITDLQKAINWINTNSRDVTVDVSTSEGNGRMTVYCMDKYGTEVEITLYAEGQMLPKIRKTESL